MAGGTGNGCPARSASGTDRAGDRLPEPTTTDEIASFSLLDRLVAMESVPIGVALQLVPAFALDGQDGIEIHGYSCGETAEAVGFDVVDAAGWDATESATGGAVERLLGAGPGRRDRAPHQIPHAGPGRTDANVLDSYAATLRGRPRGRLRAMITPESKISPPQTPQGSPRSSAIARHSARAGQSCAQDLGLLQISRRFGEEQIGLVATRQVGSEHRLVARIG